MATTETQKLCSICREVKPLSDYYFHNRNSKLKTRYNAECKKCQNAKSRQYQRDNKEKIKKLSALYYRNNKEKSKAYNLNRWYGITMEEYDEIYILQGGRCAICGIHQSELKKSLSVDHCHDTGEVRGLLCGTCNLSLGGFGDNVDVLRNALKYLENIDG